MTHTDILNQLAEKHGYKHYLEIGVQNPVNNFNRIICPYKTGVDPCQHPGIYEGSFHQMDSNSYFRRALPLIKGHPEPVEGSPEAWNTQPYDLIFIDGLHHWEQVLIDLINAYNALAPGGSIVVHDLLPTSEAMQQVPRGSVSEWTGDGWKAWNLNYINVCVDFEQIFILNHDYGCGVLYRKLELQSVSPIRIWDYSEFVRFKEENEVKDFEHIEFLKP